MIAADKVQTLSETIQRIETGNVSVGDVFPFEQGTISILSIKPATIRVNVCGEEHIWKLEKLVEN